MKILLVGLGSIGKRHLENISSLGFKDISVVSKSAEQTTNFHFCIYKTLHEALENEHFEAAIICNPTALHVETLQQLLAAQIRNIYLEKPVSHSWQSVTDIEKLIAGSTTNIKVGYDLHFDPGLQKVKELVDAKAIGKIASVNAQVGQYLPDWRPGQDYREGMSANKETGGGVMLDLIHEFDYLYWLFGDVETVAALCKNSGALQIETEDVAEVLLKFDNGIIGTIHLDYLQPELVRNCLVTGHEGSIFWDLKRRQVEWINLAKQREVFDYQGFDRNDRFVSIIKTFLTASDDLRLTSFQQGLQSLKTVLAAKHSSDSGAFVNMDRFTKNMLK